jgi:hypothetical protein
LFISDEYDGAQGGVYEVEAGTEAFARLLATGCSLRKRAYDESLFAAEEQRQRKRMENQLKRSAQQLGYN